MSLVLGTLKNIKEAADLIEVIDTFKSGCQMLSDLRNNVCDYTKTKRDSVKVEVIDLETWIRDTVTLYRPTAAGKEINLWKTIERSVPLTIATDKVRITRILSNLITNAVKFTSRAGSVSVRAYQVNDLLHVEVSDDGPGIPNGRIFDIFMPHVKLDEKAPGCGLGLAIVKVNVNDIGGEIHVKSTVGEGSTFTFTIPNLMHRD
jgi:signal transduction histidine kinase